MSKVLLYTLLLSSIASSSHASEKLIDYIDNEQTKVYGAHCAKADTQLRSIELAESISSGNIVIQNYYILMDITDKILEEMNKDLQYCKEWMGW